MSDIAARIIKGIEDARAGNWARVKIGGQAWVPETPLIAAAPELLVALEAIIRLDLKTDLRRIEYDGPCGIIARAAIAKAKGEQKEIVHRTDE